MKFLFTDVKKIQLAGALYCCMFWVPTIILFFNSHGFSDSKAYEILAIQQLIIVALEYPTGVIGDVFGHKLSVSIGFIIMTIAYFLYGSVGQIDVVTMYGILTLSALGITMISGSDIALLHSVSKDFKNDLADYSKLTGWFTAGSFVIGGLIGAINVKYPFFATSFCNFLAFLLTVSALVPKNKDVESLDIFQTAMLGMKESIMNMNIFFPLFISSVIGMYLSAEKWILATVFENAGIPISLFGLASALIILFRGQASGLFKKFGEKPYWILITLMLLSTLLIPMKMFSILGLVFVYGFAAYLIAQATITINEKVDGRARASVVSFRNLLIRLLNSPYLWVISLASLNLQFTGVNLVMSGFVLFVVLLIVIVNKYRMGNLRLFRNIIQ